MNRDDHPGRMQKIGLFLLMLLFGGWVYYQSWWASQQVENLSSGDTLRKEPLEKEREESSLKELDLSQANLQLYEAPNNNFIEQSSAASISPSSSEEQVETSEKIANLEPVVIETEVYRAELDPKGAVMRSLRLQQHNNNGQPLEMVRSVDSGLYPFTVYLGDYNDGQPVLLPFQYEQTGEHSYRFMAEFTLNGDSDPYILEKTFEFAQNEYMVKVRVRLQRKSGKSLILSQRQVIYSLYYGPQIGPEVDHIGKNRTAADMRSYVYYNGKKSKTISLSSSGRDKRLESDPIWAGISGKYFGVFGLPSRNLGIYWSGREIPGLGLDATGRPLESSQFLFERRTNKLGDNLAEDTFYYYIGPLLSNDLNIFNKTDDNEFGLSDAGFSSMLRFSLGFIEEPIKWILNWLFGFTYNYGIAIILFALIVRIVLYPLMLKAHKSGSRLRLVQPQMQKIQEKYKSDPRRLQQEIALLYRKEKVNPAGGCLPLLVQMPILIAIANLFYRYFELRGAHFISGWIDDLSTPDLVYSWELAGWNIPLRLLPIIYLASQLSSSKLMQSSQPTMQNKIQQRMFTLYMPILFSVILYNMPSGLILYWTISNILMMGQQFLMGKYYSDSGVVKVENQMHFSNKPHHVRQKNEKRHRNNRLTGKSGKLRSLEQRANKRPKTSTKYRRR